MGTEKGNDNFVHGEGDSSWICASSPSMTTPRSENHNPLESPHSRKYLSNGGSNVRGWDIESLRGELVFVFIITQWNRQI